VKNEDVAALLRCDEPLVIVEAPAGCGKTYQGAAYARDAVATLERGKLLVLAHTHASCGVFADRTKTAGSRVEIRTIASFAVEIAAAYYKVLGLPEDAESWAWKDGGAGFDIIASKCATLLIRHPMIADALARRYPLVVCDEHQDCTEDQHSILVALHAAGARMRVFGDPLQRLYTGKTEAAAKKDAQRWDGLKARGKFAELEKPHRWADGSPELGEWILEARRALLAGKPIDLTGSLPSGLTIVRADNTSPVRLQYQLSWGDRQAINSVMFADGPLMAMAINNEQVRAVNAAFGRRLRVWEGQTREALAELVEAAGTSKGNAAEIGKALIAFVNSFSAGFSMTTHGDRLLREIDEGCAKSVRGKPLLIQNIAKAIQEQPDHKGLASALRLIDTYVAGSLAGFTEVKIDHKTEFAEAIRLGQFTTVEEGALELSRRRTHLRRLPPARTISTIHKAKGHECQNALVIPCDSQFSGSYYSKCRIYVALSRASHRLTLVIPRSKASNLIKI
jgi:hypothetical protein